MTQIADCEDDLDVYVFHTSNAQLEVICNTCGFNKFFDGPPVSVSDILQAKTEHENVRES